MCSPPAAARPRSRSRRALTSGSATIAASYSRESPAVSLRSTAAIVHSNFVRGGSSSLAVAAVADRVTMVGNATSGAITINQQPLTGTVWEHLNVRV